MSDFLLELLSEEIPARMQAGAREEMEKLFRREMDAAGVALGKMTVWSTPRRLALIARDLPEATEAVSEEAKGPPEGAPDAAIDGFCRKAGVSRDQLTLRDVKGRNTYFAVIERPGRAVKDVLAEAIPAIIRDFAWPKSMRWGAESISTESLRWVRPLQGIVAMLGDEVVECSVGNFFSTDMTLGHRFHDEGSGCVGNADEYLDRLAGMYVYVDQEVRQDLIRENAKKAAEDAGLKLVEDEGLVIENAGLTEWPVPLLGRFDEAFLDVPPEVIQLTARVNQKYFVCEDSAGKLANAFVCVANIWAEDPAVVVDGNRKVLAARLSDARFFWELDQKTSLADHAKKLERITFHEKLGTVADKVERVAKLARWLCEEGIIKADPDLAEQAARLCKADLVTEMVGEFPELQGLMGGYYAEKEGLPQEVSDAIRDHYKPVGQGDEVPTAPVTVAVSLADKLDTLVGFFMIDERPTGSKDPFALRRATLGVSSLTLECGLRSSLFEIADQLIQILFAQAETSLETDSATVARYWLRTTGVFPEAATSTEWTQDWFQNRKAIDSAFGKAAVEAKSGLLDFFADRLKVQQREAGVRHDLIDAVFALGGEDDLVRLLARVKALQSFMDTDDGANLLAGYKRAANILKKEEWKEAALSYTPEEAEKALIDALDAAEPKAEAAIEAEDFAAAMTALASLRAPIDRFFDEVTVNADEEIKRAYRLGLLDRFRAAVHKVADFSRIEG